MLHFHQSIQTSVNRPKQNPYYEHLIYGLSTEFSSPAQREHTDEVSFHMQIANYQIKQRCRVIFKPCWLLSKKCCAVFMAQPFKTDTLWGARSVVQIQLCKWVKCMWFWMTCTHKWNLQLRTCACLLSFLLNELTQCWLSPSMAGRFLCYFKSCTSDNVPVPLTWWHWI